MNKDASPRRTIRNVHRFLALLLGLFIVSHLAIHLSALGGADRHIANLSFVQGVYRNLFIEPLLVFAIIAQVFLGIKLLRYRWSRVTSDFWSRLQLWSGLYLAMFLLVHTSAALLTRTFFAIDTNFFWAAATVNIAPIKFMFIPYYFLGVLSIFAHLAAAAHYGLSTTGRMIAPALLITGVIIAATIVAIFAGAFFEIEIPRNIFDLYSPPYLSGVALFN